MQIVTNSVDFEMDLFQSILVLYENSAILAAILNFKHVNKTYRAAIHSFRPYTFIAPISLYEFIFCMALLHISIKKPYFGGHFVWC